MKTSTYAQEQFAKIESMVEKLSTELNQGKSERFKEYLIFASKFHKYSMGNQMLIHYQMKTATRVASYDKWIELGRQVQAGQKGIKILSPIIKKEKNKQAETEDRLVGFRVSNVYDISQTEGKELPKFFQDLNDDGLALYNTLKSVMIEQGITVEEKDLGTTQGVSYGGRVEIHSGIDGTNKFLTLIHEFAHEILHKGSENAAIPRGIKECQAEAAAYIVANVFGIESPVSSDYLINWGNDVETLKANLNPVIKASKTIISLLSQENESEEQLNEEALVAA